MVYKVTHNITSGLISSLTSILLMISCASATLNFIQFLEYVMFSFISKTPNMLSPLTRILVFLHRANFSHISHLTYIYNSSRVFPLICSNKLPHFNTYIIPWTSPLNVKHTCKYFFNGCLCLVSYFIFYNRNI